MKIYIPCKKNNLKFIFLSLLVAPLMHAPSNAKELAFDVVAMGLVSDLKASATYTLKNDNELAILGRFHGQGNLPGIDFQKYMLVGIFIGQRPSSEFSVRVKLVDESDDLVKVVYLEDRGRTDKYPPVYPPMVTDPFVFIKMKKTDNIVIFEKYD